MGSEADTALSFASRSPPAPNTPFPKSRRKGGGVPSRRSAAEFPLSPQWQRRVTGRNSKSKPKSSTQHGHGNLFGPVQNMMGSLLQRSVQVGAVCVCVLVFVFVSVSVCNFFLEEWTLYQLCPEVLVVLWY